MMLKRRPMAGARLAKLLVSITHTQSLLNWTTCETTAEINQHQHTQKNGQHQHTFRRVVAMHGSPHLALPTPILAKLQVD